MIREVTIYGSRLSTIHDFHGFWGRDSNAELDGETRICTGMLECDQV